MSNKPPAFQLYASDFYMDTNSWTIDEIGIYTRLLLSEWVNGPLPNDITRLARTAGCSTKRFQKGWSQIKLKFSETEDNKLFNSRLEEVRQKHKEYQEKQRLKGIKGAEKRWSENMAAAIAPAMPVPQPEHGSSSSSPNIKEKKINKEKKRSDFVLPDCVPKESWDGFVESRKKKKPLTDRAKTLIVNKLIEFRARGHDPGKILDEATEKGWMSVYEPKPQGGNGGYGSGYKSRTRIPEPVSREDEEAIERINRMARELAQKAAIDKTKPNA